MAKSRILPLIGSNFITWHNDGRQFSISKSDARFVKIRQLLKAKKYDEALLQFDKPAAIAKYTEGKVQVFGDTVTYNGETVNGTIVGRILAFVEEGLPFEPLVAFLNNLYDNTDKEIRDALYDFIEWNGLTITDDGAFIAYKLTTDKGKPIYYDNGKFTYELGGTYELPKCDTVKARGECSSEALYIGSKLYWDSSKFDINGNYTGDGKMWVVKVFPQHVIAVPEQSKKCCVYKFQIIEEYKKVVGEFKKPLYKWIQEIPGGLASKIKVSEESDKDDCCGGKCGCEDSQEIEYDDTSKGIYGMDYITNVPVRDKFGQFVSKNRANKKPKFKRDASGRFKSMKKSAK